MSGAEPDYDDQIALARDEFDRLSTRLRSLSRLAWLSRRPAVEAVLAQLEAVTATAEQRPARPIPTIPDHALADAVVVLGQDALAALDLVRDLPALEYVVSAVRAALAATR